MMRFFLILFMLFSCFCAHAQKEQVERYFNSIAVKHPEESKKLEALKDLVLGLRPGRNITVGIAKCLGDMNAKYFISSVGVAVYFVPAYDSKYNFYAGYNSIVKTRLSNYDSEKFDEFPLSADGLRINKQDNLFIFQAKKPVLLTSFVSNGELKKLWDKKGIAENSFVEKSPIKEKTQNLPRYFLSEADSYLFNNDENYTGGACYSYSTNKLLKKLLEVLIAEAVENESLPVKLLFGGPSGPDGLFVIASDVIKADFSVSIDFKQLLDYRLKRLSLLMVIDEKGKARNNYLLSFSGLMGQTESENKNFEFFLGYLDGGAKNIEAMGFSSSLGIKAFIESLSKELYVDYKRASKIGEIDPRLQAETSSYERLLLYLDDPTVEKDALIEKVLLKMEIDLKTPDTDGYRMALSVMEDIAYISKTPGFLYSTPEEIQHFLKLMSILVEINRAELMCLTGVNRIVDISSVNFTKMRIEKLRTSISRVLIK